MTNPLTEQEKVDLVAFLDGELTGEAARSLETRLSLDPAARAEAEAFKRTWDLLDFLPKPEASPNFTNRTLERLVPVPTAALRKAAPRGRPWLWGVGWAAALAVAASVGFVAVGRFGPGDAPDRELTRDLRVIENKRLYDRVDDLDYLKALDQPDLFGDDASGS